MACCIMEESLYGQSIQPYAVSSVTVANDMTIGRLAITERWPAAGPGCRVAFTNDA